MLPTRIGLSTKRHVPIVYFCGGSFYPHTFLKAAWEWRKLTIIHRDESWVVLKHNQTILKMGLDLAYVMVREWHGPWTQYYLPPFPLEGKTVLDVGAGCGETAYFYLSHGAKKIVCVEPDKNRFSSLQENVVRNHWNVEAFQIPFNLEILKRFKFDFMKMDCEGCESQLLELNKLPLCAIEVHSKAILDGLLEKFSLIVSPKSKETDLWLAKCSSYDRNDLGHKAEDCS